MSERKGDVPTFEKVTFYDQERFFGADWLEAKSCFLERWVPAQNRAAVAGLAPKVFEATVENETFVWRMERVDGATLLDVVESWKNDPAVDDDELIARLEELLAKAEAFHRRLYDATGGGHPDWAARNVLQRAGDGRWFALDFENWCPDESYEPEPICGGVFAMDLAQSFHPQRAPKGGSHARRRRKIYDFLVGKRTSV